MAVVEQFETPARLRDIAPNSPRYQAWRAAWHEEVRTHVSTAPRGQWFDPLVTDVDGASVRSLSWIGFPRTQLTVVHRDDREAAFREADQPSEPMPDRQLQDEYFEWHVTRDADGRITKVVFVTETPEYWRVLGATDPDALVALYRKVVHPDVSREDLFPDGSTYDERNRWNTVDGIAHFIMPINNLRAVVGLTRGGAESTDPQFGTTVADNFEMIASQVPTAVDDYLPIEAGALARKGLFITAHDPVGIYIDGWDDTGWTTPDGRPVGDYWRITRGVAGSVLRLEYEVPAGEGFVVGDIRIGGRPVTHGGQLAEHITAAIPVVIARSTS